MSIVERARSTKAIDTTSGLVQSIVFLAELEERAMRNWQDSNGELLDSRLASWMKLKLEYIRALHEMDPNTKREEIEMQKKAELALAMAKKQVELDTKTRMKLVRKPG